VWKPFPHSQQFYAALVVATLTLVGSPGITRGFFIGWFERGGKKTELLE
jgi:hypothetical protein